MRQRLSTQFEELKIDFLTELEKNSGYKVFKKITEMINKLGGDFLSFDGGELSDIQIRLSGYKYYLSDYVSEFQRLAEYYSIEIKNIRAEK